VPPSQSAFPSTNNLVTPERLVAVTDACMDCGTVYVVRIEKVKGQLKIEEPGLKR
jgi:hypothetical protein